jgi:hypothetical protein
VGYRRADVDRAPLAGGTGVEESHSDQAENALVVVELKVNFEIENVENVFEPVAVLVIGLQVA